MPKFIEQIIEQIIENRFWNDDYFEIPDFPSGSEEEFLFPDDIETL